MYAITDIETTGGNYKKDKVIEIAIFLHNGTKITDSFVSLINPGVNIPNYITHITGINNEMVKNSPSFKDLAYKITEMTISRTFIAHNVLFDYNFIKEEFKNLGYRFQRKRVCTIKLAQKYLPGHRSYALGNICKDLNIINHARHRAEGDAMATTKLFEIILKEMKNSNDPISLDQYKLF